jgi:hypothetical protein
VREKGKGQSETLTRYKQGRKENVSMSEGCGVESEREPR